MRECVAGGGRILVRRGALNPGEEAGILEVRDLSAPAQVTQSEAIVAVDQDTLVL